MASSGGREMAKKTSAPQTNMTMSDDQGITRPGDLERQGAVDLRRAAVSASDRRLYRMAKTRISTAISTRKRR